MKLKFAIPALLVVGGAAFIYRDWAAEAEVWSQLHLILPAGPIAKTEAMISAGPLAARISPQGDEIGSIQLGNGDVWRFAFRSHHRLGGNDSYSVFAGPAGTFRVKGPWFCCEVQMPDDSVPKDSAEFLAFLRRGHTFVAPVQ